MDEQRGSRQGWRQRLLSSVPPKKKPCALGWTLQKTIIKKKIKNKATYLLKPTASRCLLEPPRAGSTEKGTSEAMLSPPLSPSRALRLLTPSPKPSPWQHGAEEGGGEKGVGEREGGISFIDFYIKK